MRRCAARRKVRWCPGTKLDRYQVKSRNSGAFVHSIALVQSTEELAEVLLQETSTELRRVKCNCADRQKSIGCCCGCFQVPDHLNCMILNAISWQGQKARRLWSWPCLLHTVLSSCRTISTRSMLGPSLSSLCNRRCSWITRASRARRYVLSSVIYALQPLPIRKPFEGCMVGGCQSHINPKVRSCSR
jgi:hypothetical protein